ncbi:class E sortase [Cellulomonas sp. NPDC089187]|uniref:class E sortase n=1 Tax=Cellulomonas sp. NPDC089187 TaxID=3154970 RepID=UPI00343BC41B
MSGTYSQVPGFDDAIVGAGTDSRRARRVQEGRHGRAQRRRRGGFAGAVLGLIGVVGELLITAGVLLLAFLGWQLWWTDIEGNREQAAVVEAGGWNDPLENATQIVTPRYDDPPVLEQPEYLTTFASMRVPRWEGEPTRTITQGTDRPNVLNPLGVGHYDGVAMPGGLGNFALAAHRTTYGKPFNRIAELQPGDPIVVWTQDTWYVYRVTGSDIVYPKDVWTIAPDPQDPSVTNETATQRLITLTSCHPMYSARERYIVWGELDYWAPTSEGIPAELEGVEL